MAEAERIGGERALPAPPEGRDLAELVYRDDLTGLLNRRYLFPQLEKMVTAAGEGEPFSLVMIDLDRFKSVNDTHGHLAGDNALALLAKRISAAVRDEDIVVRYAGDEFMILMPGTETTRAMRIAERLRVQVGGTPFDVLDATSVRLTLSLGVAGAPEHARSPIDLIQAADKAMYVSKQKGRNRVSMFGETPPGAPHIGDLLAGFPCASLVGRSIALARCESLSNMGEFGPTTMVLIQGEGGLGKTRMLAEMARRRYEGGNLTLWSVCREELRSAPYAPIIDMLRSRFHSDSTLQSEVLSVLSDDQRFVLGLRIPEFRVEGVAEPDVPPKTKRSRFFTAIIDVLRYLARERHVCLFFDDLQYADAATRQVLAYLLRHDRHGQRTAGIPIFATVATDSVEAMSDESYTDFRETLAGCATFGAIDLRPLQRTHVAKMIEICFPRNTFPESLGARVYEVARGVPLVVEEVLILLALSGFILPAGEGWRLERRGRLTIADNLSEILMAHLATLDEETSGALLKASVIGSRFSVDLLRRVLEINEGHAVQLTDKAIKHRLLSGGDPSTMEGLSFVNRRLRQLTYEIVGDELKRDVHRKTAVAREGLKVVDLDEAFAEIAHHYEASGDRRRGASSRARVVDRAAKMFRPEELRDYFEIAGKVAAPRIEAQIVEATTPLDEDALQHMPEVMKGMVSVQRAIQMYPPGSRFIAGTIDACLQALRTVLQQADSVTLKERAGRFEVNGKRYDADRWGTVGSKLVNDFQQALLHSVTFTRAVSDKDIETLAVGMLRFSEQGVTSEWQQFMTERGARGVGVVPKRFRATADGELALGRGAELEGLAADSARHLPMLQQILRYTAAAAEAVNLYPRGSATVRNAVSGLAKSFQQVHKALPTVNLGVTQEGFLVNDLRIDARSFGPGVQVMRDLFARNGATSVSFHRGVGDAEIEIFFRYLGKGRGQGADVAGWLERMEKLDVKHIGVDEYVFVAADAQGGGTSDAGEEVDLVRIDRKTFLNKVLQGSPGELLDPKIRDALPRFLSDLVLEGDAESPREVVAKVFANMDAPEPHLRVAALDVVAELLGSTSRVVARDLRGYATEHVAQCLREERAPAPLGRLVSLGEEAADQALHSGDMLSASRILWQLGKAIPADTDIDTESRRLAAHAVSRLMHSAAFQRALSTLWSPNEKRKTLALHLLESCGHQAAERLLQLIVDSPDDEARRTFASQLRAVADPEWLEESVVKAITPQTTATRARNVLMVIDTLVKNVFPALVRAFLHPDSVVIAEAIKLLHRLGPDDRKTVLVALLRIPEPEMRLRAVVLIGELAPRETAGELLPMLSDPGGTARDLQRELCNALGRLGDGRAVGPLILLLRSTRWTRLLKRDPPSEVRVAAVWALGNFHTDEARRALDTVRDDRDAKVRRAAEAVLAAGSVHGSR